MQIKDRGSKVKGFSTPLFIFVGILFFAVVSVAFWRWKENTNTTDIGENSTSNVGENFVFQSPDPTAKWKKYTVEGFGVEFKYPKEFTFSESLFDPGTLSATEAAEVASGISPQWLTRTVFRDSNNRNFFLFVYPVSSDPARNTNTNNLQEYSGHCGIKTAKSVLINRVVTQGEFSYKQVSQINKNGASQTDFCFFNGSGNLLVLRNISSSTEITMKSILSTVRIVN